MSALLHSGGAPATPDAQTAFLRACMLDVAVCKPGNVSGHSAGHRMEAAVQAV